MGGGLVESRLLLLTGKESDVKRAKEMLNQLDVKPPQFIYEARLVEMSKDNATKLGLTYDLGRAIQIGENDLGGQPNTTVNGIAGGRQPNGGAIFRTPYSIATKIDALATLGKANILARPTLSALDGNQAVTFIGDQVPYVISQSIGPTGGLNVQTGIASAGIRLQVSGRSNGDGTMTIYVHPEISTITQFVGGLPQISTRFVDTMIRVKNGETIAIGGLVQKTEIDNMRKIPLIGDLPILGQLFRSSDKSIKESEVLIFITCSLSKD
jgi:type II secretory pathway component GspD/PulD (secretin)